ncbi:MAG: hypothetical protein ACI9YT_002004 [Halobacteriales archaeon]|jgi:hypothetical protein
MAGRETETTDMGIGLTLAFGVLALIGALVMVVGAPAKIAGVGFAVAVVFAALATVAAQGYGPAPNE